MRSTLSTHDSAIWRTLQINDLIDAGRFAEAETVGTPFPPSLGGGERVITAGGFVLHEFTAIGDGSYAHHGNVMVATGRYGMAMMAGSAIGTMVGNSARRRAAQEAATQRWRPIDQGVVYISDWGFYLQTPRGLSTWSWQPLSSAQLGGPRMLAVTGTSTTGEIHWTIESDWAELIFTLWARARHPQHPQLLGGVWVPEGWAARIARSQYDPPPSLSGRWQPLTIPPGKGDKR